MDIAVRNLRFGILNKADRKSLQTPTISRCFLTLIVSVHIVYYTIIDKQDENAIHESSCVGVVSRSSIKRIFREILVAGAYIDYGMPKMSKCIILHGEVGQVSKCYMDRNFRAILRRGEG